jgi:excisionase family DNA binding protein
MSAPRDSKGIGRLPPPDRPQSAERTEDVELMTVPEVMQALRISRFQLYRLIGSGRLPSISFGRSRRVRRSALKSYLERLEQETTASAWGQEDAV